MRSTDGAGQGDWTRRYATRLLISDVIAVVVSIGAAQVLRFGLTMSLAELGRGTDATVSYTVMSLILIALWLLTLTVFRTRDARVVGVGAGEYRLVVVATLALFGLAAIVFYIFQIPFARAYLLIALPYGIILLLLGRWLCRQWLVRQRLAGEASYRVLVIGSRPSATPVIEDLRRRPQAGYTVVGAIIPASTTKAPIARNATSSIPVLPADLPIVDTLDDVQGVMARLGADTLIITGSDELDAERVREVSWALEPGRQHLVMVPKLTDVAGPRIHTRPVAGLQLMHVETPTFGGPQLLIKRFFDLVGSTVLLVLLSPFLLAIALVVKLSSPGPVLFPQERVGLRGRTFRMLKFRSMVVDAEEQLAGLLDRQRDLGNDVLFKLKDDPRITRVGRFMRRYSIDELPQLFNVFAGTMSLVGPRPPLPREVEQYDERVHRKFLVKSGVTGLWQVNGRSSLSWEESVRLDLYYVENWSLIGDIVILWRTVKAVIGKHGAY